MTKDDGLRIATAAGAMLIAASAGDEAVAAGAALLDPGHWRVRGQLEPAGAGRGAAWFVGEGGGWVLRHYRRGGMAARLSADRYLWMGESRVRSFAEYHLLAHLHSRGLPVPEPIAAGYVRQGPSYGCDLLTRRIPGARPLSAWLAEGALDGAAWRAIGAAIARLHAAGADHADLNAHNVLLDAAGRVSVIDFDRSRLRTGDGFAAGNLERLRRSLAKVAAPLPAGRYADGAWRELLAGYRASVGAGTGARR